MRRRLSWMTGVMALAVLSPTGARGQSVGPVIDSVFQEWRVTSGPGCTVGIEHEGRRTTRAYGMANLEYGLALTPESVVESGSVAKQFTSAALVLLHQRGKLSLDDDIRKHLPEVPDFGRLITIRHLLHHTSGLRDQWGLLGMQGFPPGREVHTLGRILDIVSRQRRLNFPPGQEYLYSNTGYSLAGIIVTRVAGKSFAEFSRDELFQPLGMHATEWRDDYRRVVPNRATAYDRERTGWVQDMPFTMVHGNGGLLTTVHDLLVWNAALSAGTIPGGAELVRMLETPGRLNDGSEISYALGLRVAKDRGLRHISHSGATAGYRTYLARWPERSLSIAVLCNAATANPVRMGDNLAHRILGLPASEAPPAPVVAIQAAELTPLAGAYRDSTNDQVLRFAVRDSQLTVSPGGPGPGAPLAHLGGLWFWNASAGELRFEPNGTGYRVVRFADAWRRYEPFTAPDSGSVRVADYVGRYRSPELDVQVEIDQRNGRLVLRRPPDQNTTLLPEYADGFRNAGMTLRFQRGRNGRVTGFRVFAGRVLGLEFERLP